jgi:hypothetical protein
VEIRTTRIDLAKRGVVGWFKENGLSEQSVCDYPVVFHLSQDVIKQLENTTVVFSPVGPGY